MGIPSGNRLGPYEIISAIGAGGMGEVYRARDTRLNRTVAIKILPSHLANNPDLKLRFEREARAISGLSHPNICTLFDIGHQDGIDYLVMEYLEGETLFERLKKGSLATEQVLRFGIEIAEALNKAHRQGIVHRDLKPGNIMLTRSGAKLLDFGLAKLSDEFMTAQSEGVSALQTEAKELTGEGTILGTVQYMSPEQLEGKQADERTDIFALGSVLYEMATGQKAFTGSSKASLISAILKEDAARVSQVQPTTPPAFDHVVKKCLAKDPEDRWQNAHDIAGELRWIAESSSQILAPVTPRKRFRNRERFWMAISSALLLLAILSFVYARKSKPNEAQLVRFEIRPPAGSIFQGTIALSPDGKKIAFIAAGENGIPALWVRSIDSTEAQRLPETEQASFPFWSPDSRFIAYFLGGKLRKIESSGGTPQVICDASDGRGGAWSENGTIVFSRSANEGLFRTSSQGGKVEPQVEPQTNKEGGGSLRWPVFLPDGKHFLYVYITGTADTVGIYAGSIGSTESKKLLPIVSRVQYAEPGYLLYIDQENLMARPFDADKLEFKGDPLPVANQPWVDYFIYGSSGFSVSGNHILAYRQGGHQLGQFTWFDRSGKKLSTIGPLCRANEPAFSPDESRIVYYQWDTTAGLSDEWILDLASGKPSRFTFDPADDNTSVWSPDGSRIVWASIKTGWYELYQKLATGAGGDEPLLVNQTTKYPDDFSPDGKYLLYDEISSSIDLWILPMMGDKKPFVYLKTAANESHGQFSPDGNWIAYTSDESGRSEIYVQGFPAEGRGKWQVSNAGGDQVQWRRDGKELFYVAPDSTLMSVEVHSTDSDFSSSIPTSLFTNPIHFGITSSRNDYLVSEDGQRFLVNAPLEDTARLPITVVLNWTELLKK